MNTIQQEVRKTLIDELRLMDNPLDQYTRGKSWTIVLNLLIQLKRIDSYIINNNMREIKFTHNDKLYHVFFGNSEEEFHTLCRDLIIDDIIDQ